MQSNKTALCAMKETTNHVWCVDCLKKKPPVVENSEHLIPYRDTHYGLMKDGVTVDYRVVGVCSSCLEKRNDFQQKYKQPLDLAHPHIIRKPP